MIFPYKKAARQKFKHVISLGQYCGTAYQTRRYFNIHETHFFDYHRTSIGCLGDLINTDFQDVLLPGNLSMTPDRQYIKDEKYNLFIYHDFRNAQGIIEDNYIDLYPVFKSKSDYLIGKFRKVLDSNDTCLFVCARNRFRGQNYEDTAVAIELEKAFQNRAPGLIPKILYIDTFSNLSEGVFGNFSEVVQLDFDLEEKDSIYQNCRKNVLSERWKGSDLAWDKILKPYRYSQKAK